MGEEGKQQEGRTHQEEEQVWKGHLILGNILRMCPEKVWKPMEGRERPQKVMESHRRLRNSWEGTKQV